MPTLKGTNTTHGLVRFQSMETDRVGKRLASKTYHYLFVAAPIASRSGDMASGLTASWRVTLRRNYGWAYHHDSVIIRVEKSGGGGSGKSKAHHKFVFTEKKKASTFFSKHRSRLSGKYPSGYMLNEMMKKLGQKNPRM